MITILCFDQHQSQWSYFQGQKIISILHRPYFGSPCRSVSSKTGLFWFHCLWFWIPYRSQILEICVILLVKFNFYGQASGDLWHSFKFDKSLQTEHKQKLLKKAYSMLVGVNTWSKTVSNFCQTNSHEICDQLWFRPIKMT